MVSYFSQRVRKQKMFADFEEAYEEGKSASEDVSNGDVKSLNMPTTTTRKDRASTEEFGTHSAGPLDQPRRVVTNGVAVKVIVLEKDTGSSLADAEVLAPNQAAFFGGVENSPRWTTDASGSVVIRLGDIPPEPISQNGWFTISVRRSGYAPAGLSWSVEKGDARARIPPEITVHLKHGVTIGGRISPQSPRSRKLVTNTTRPSAPKRRRQLGATHCDSSKTAPSKSTMCPRATMNCASTSLNPVKTANRQPGEGPSRK